MITFRVAENLASGRGFVYNPGERVQVTTTPLYALILAPGVWLFGSAPTAALILNIALAGLIPILAYDLGRHLSGRITGAGGAFSTGEDISGADQETAWPYGIPKGTSLNATYNKFRDSDRKDILGRQLYRWQYPKPIVGAVSGWCFGAGSWLALTCHVTIAADDAVFGQPQVRHGANTDFIWVALAGFKNALRYSLTGDHVDAQEALRIGLVN